MKPVVILLFQYPPQFNNPMQNTYLGLVICCLFLIQFSCCVHVRIIISWEWVGSSAAMLVFWHNLLYPFTTFVDGFIYIFAWGDCPCCYIIVHFHWFDLGSKIDTWVPHGSNFHLEKLVNLVKLFLCCMMDAKAIINME